MTVKRRKSVLAERRMIARVDFLRNLLKGADRWVRMVLPRRETAVSTHLYPPADALVRQGSALHREKVRNPVRDRVQLVSDFSQ